MRKRVISLNEIKSRIKTSQLIRVRTKMSIKIIKKLDEPDFIIEKFELPTNYMFHTFIFNLNIPKLSTMLIEVYESNGDRLINQVVFHHQNAPFYANVLFYTDVKHVNLTFKLNTSNKEEIYYLFKVDMESNPKIDLNLLEIPLFQKEILKAVKTDIKIKNLEELEDSFVFQFIKLFNINVDRNVIHQIRKLTEKYTNLLSCTLLPIIGSKLGTIEKTLYNLVLYVINNYRYQIKTEDTIDQTSITLQEINEIYAETNAEFGYILQDYKRMREETSLIVESLTNIKETIHDYKLKYQEISNDLRLTINRQVNYSNKKEAMERSEYEVAKLEDLKDLLLRELCRVRKIQRILKSDNNGNANNNKDNNTNSSNNTNNNNKDNNNDNNSEENDFISKFQPVMDVLYTEIGKDVLQIDAKIQDYMEILAYFRGDLEQSELEDEIQNLVKSGQDILTNVTELKAQWVEQQDKFKKLKGDKITTLIRYLEFKIMNILLEELRQLSKFNKIDR